MYTYCGAPIAVHLLRRTYRSTPIAALWRAAPVLTVSPMKVYLGHLTPTTPAKAGPVCIPILPTTSRNIYIYVYIYIYILFI